MCIRDRVTWVRNVEVCASCGGKQGCRATPVGCLGHCAQGPSRDPCARAFVPGDRSPAARTDCLATCVYAANNRAGTGDDDQAWCAFGGAVERNISIANDNYFTDAQTEECFTHTRVQFPPTCPGQSDFRSNQIGAPQLRVLTSPIDCFTNRGGRTSDAHPQRI